MVKHDVAVAGKALQALFRGEDTEESLAGGMMLGAAIISLFVPPKGGKGGR